MSGPAQADITPFFLESADRRLFALVGRPAGGVARHGLLVCPAFADEMNRSRRTLRLLCEAAAGAGVLTLEIDLGGTGDSSGEFGDASWQSWLGELAAAAAWLRGEGCTEISLLGVRAGALLAWDLVRTRAVAPHRLVLWQPVLTGKSVVTDLLRARIAAAAGLGIRETVNGLRERLAAGEPVEAAGYVLSAGLVRALDASAIDAGESASLPPIAWLEIVAGAESATRQPAVDAVAGLQAAGVRVDLMRQQDPPFWGTTETSTGRGTVASTLRWLAEA